MAGEWSKCLYGHRALPGKENCSFSPFLNRNSPGSGGEERKRNRTGPLLPPLPFSIVVSVSVGAEGAEEDAED